MAVTVDASITGNLVAIKVIVRQFQGCPFYLNFQSDDLWNPGFLAATVVVVVATAVVMAVVIGSVISSVVLVVPVIASGGAGTKEHFAEVLGEAGGADAALAASLFHFGELTVPEVKRYLQGRGIAVRPPKDL